MNLLVVSLVCAIDPIRIVSAGAAVLCWKKAWSILAGGLIAGLVALLITSATNSNNIPTIYAVGSFVGGVLDAAAIYGVKAAYRKWRD